MVPTDEKTLSDGTKSVGPISVLQSGKTWITEARIPWRRFRSPSASVDVAMAGVAGPSRLAAEKRPFMSPTL